MGWTSASSFVSLDPGARWPFRGDRTVLEVLRGGVEAPFSGELGVCGTCMTRVLEGMPDHRDSYFADAGWAAGDRFTPC